MNTPTNDELTYLESIIQQKRYSPADREKMYSVYNRIFGTNKRPTSCGKCLANTHRELMNIYNKFKTNNNG